MIPVLATTRIDLLHLFFPRLCHLCKRSLTDSEQSLCLHCIERLPRTANVIPADSDPIAERLAWHGRLEQTFACLYYTKGGEVQQLIHAFKYHGKKELAFTLGRLAALETVSKEGGMQAAHAIVPVPLTRIRQWRRGYNQAEWIARGIGSVWQLPVCQCLKRTRRSTTQTRKSVYERLQSTEDIITVTDPARYAGRHLLLVDDVMTTGGTLGACLEALHTIPDVRVSILVLSIV